MPNKKPGDGNRNSRRPRRRLLGLRQRRLLGLRQRRRLGRELSNSKDKEKEEKENQSGAAR